MSEKELFIIICNRFLEIIDELNVLADGIKNALSDYDNNDEV